MTIPAEVQVHIEDSAHFAGEREVWPTTAEPTSPLWKHAFHRAASDYFGSQWRSAGFVVCGASEHADVAAAFPTIVTDAAANYARATEDPELVAFYSDEPDHRFPIADGRYSIPA